eukprot:gene24624-33092_t
MFGGIPSFLSSSIADQFNNHFNFAANATNLNAPASNSSSCPPASRKVLSNLPLVTVTADDLLEASNKECTVCLDEQKLELETDDVNFEMARLKRMESRKIRIRLDELKAKSIGQLKELCKNLGVNINGCIDKSEIIDRVARSDKVIITAGVPQMKMTEEELYSKNVAELRHLLLSFGLSCEGALEKSELRQKLLDSERIALIDRPAESSESNASTATATRNTNTNMNLKVSGEEIESAKVHLGDKSSPFTATQLREMKLSELRKHCEVNGVSIKDCIDKEEVLQRILSSQSSAAISSSPPASSTSSPPLSSSSSSSTISKVQLSREILAQLPIRELRNIMETYGINSQNCLYRSDIIERLQNCNKIQIID